MNTIYLDHAAATPLDERVLAAMQPYFSTVFHNPSATYLAAKQVRQDLDAARVRVARVLGVRATEIIFTAGGTEANNLAVHGIMQSFPGKNVIVSAIEHESVLAPAHQYSCHEALVDATGLLNLPALERLIDADTVLISVMYANNEVGTIQPLRDVAVLIQGVVAARRKVGNMLPLYLHTDAAQASNYLNMQVSRMGVDLMTINGGKIYGPKQSGALWIRTGITLRPLLQGGGQERNIRSGTENVAGAIGFSIALQLTQDAHSEESARVQRLQHLFFDLVADQLPAVTINGSRKKRLPNNVHLTFSGQDNERLLMSLDEAGIMAAAGSACSASNEEPSHVLRAMGISIAAAQSSLRFTLGRETTEVHIRHTVAVLSRLIG